MSSDIDAIVKRDYDPQSKTDEPICFEGFRVNTVKRIVYWFLVIISCGFFWLFGRWIPSLYVAFNLDRVPLYKATRICGKGLYKEISVVETEDLNSALSRAGSPKYFVFRYQTWRWYDDVEELSYCARYRPVLYPFDKPIAELFKAANDDVRALHFQALPLKKYVYGENLISVPIPNIINLLFDEVLHPFYLFQLFSVILWYVEIYYTYATAIVIISGIGAIIGVVQARKNLLNLKKLAEFECPVSLLTPNGFKTVSSRQLVPGDAVQIREGLVLPCDMVLLKGQCVINESMLTGESVPVVKSSVVPDEYDTYNPAAGKHAKYTLYGGTHVLQIKQTNSPIVLGMVIQTGFSTTKGSLVRSIMYPKPLQMKFYRDSFYFIAFLFLLSCSGFAAMIVRFVRLGVDWEAIVIRGLDLFTIAIPPALPIALTIGVVFAVSRLKDSKISCIAPSRVNLAGLVNMFCFDKTGTLTEDGLDVMGVRAAEFGEFIPEEKELATTASPDLLKVLTSCHSLALLGGTFIGDSLEVKMFEATGWHLHEVDHESHLAQEGLRVLNSQPGGALQYGILKQFDFSSDHQRMSTICKDMKTNEIFICCKGAPEVISQLANPSSVPKEFPTILTGYTKCGFRVLGCSIRKLDLPLNKVLSMSREEVEDDLNFCGLLIMQNKLKRETLPALKLLNHARIGSIMVTGDNPLTACYVAIGCELVSKNKPIYLAEVVEGEGLLWRNIDNHREPPRELFSLLQGSFRVYSTLESEYMKEAHVVNPNVELAVTGTAFEYLLKEQLEFNTVLNHAHIYARMKPDQKQQLVEKLAELGHTVGMCGDGANDCGALKAADVGISLSEAEASIAAPFTSAIPNIGCVIDLLREGRCAMVTSFQAFKYMASYSLIQFSSSMILYALAALLSDMEFLWIDLFIVMPLAFASEYTGAHHKLSKRKPIPSLVSWTVITSLILQNAINLAFQLLAFGLLYTQDWFVPLVPDKSGDNSNCWEVTTVFLVANFQYIFSVLAYSVGRPFRKAFYTNYAYVITLIVLLGLNITLLLLPGGNPVGDFVIDAFAMKDFTDYNFRIILLLVVVANSVLVVVAEEIHHYLLSTKDICKEQKKAGKSAVRK